MKSRGYIKIGSSLEEKAKAFYKFSLDIYLATTLITVPTIPRLPNQKKLHPGEETLFILRYFPPLEDIEGRRELLGSRKCIGPLSEPSHVSEVSCFSQRQKYQSQHLY